MFSNGTSLYNTILILVLSFTLLDLTSVVKEDVQVALVRSLNAMDWEESVETFDSVSEGIAVMKAVFEKHMPDYYVHGSVSWTHMQSKESLSKFCFYGLAQYHAKAVNAGKVVELLATNAKVSY